MQLLKQLYMTLLRGLRQQYLEDLLEMQALCTLLCGMRSPAQAKVNMETEFEHSSMKEDTVNIAEPTTFKSSPWRRLSPIY